MTAKDMIVTPPEKELKLPSNEVSFSLTEDELNSILKTAAVLQSPNISVESDGDKVTVTVFNSKDDSAHTNTTEIGDATDDKIFKAVFLTENFKMVSDTYNVEISSAGLSSFKNEAGDMQYFIAIEAKDSKFGG